MVDQLTEDNKKEFTEVFSYFDKDGSGSITTKELGTIMRSLGQNPTETELQEMIQDVNPDNSYVIECHHFLELMGRKMACKDKDEELLEAFRVFDQDNTGSVSVTDLKHVLTNLGEKLTMGEEEEMMKEAELEENVNYKDFIEMMNHK